MTRQKCWFPVPGIDRDDVEYALARGPELTDEQARILGRFADALATLEVQIAVPEVETHAKCLDTSPAAEELLQDFRSALDRVQEGITGLGGASFACFPFGFSRGNRSCQGESDNPNSPVCVLCRKLHGYEWALHIKESGNEYRKLVKGNR